MAYRAFTSLKGIRLLLCVAFLPACLCWGQPAASASDPTALTLNDFVRQVLQYNDTVQIRLLEVAISNRRYRAERGVFEPELFASVEHLRNERENTVEQRVSLGTTYFAENNTLYNGGVEMLTPTGARVRLGYNLRDLWNNLPQRVLYGVDAEFQTFAGASLVQPLLKNGWSMATLAGIRLAATASEVAYQDYRRQTMMILSAAESAYWDLYLAQEQLRLSRESVSLADSLLHDVRVSFEVGKSNELDVAQAQTGLAVRQSRQSEARQKAYETMNRLMAFYAGSVMSTNGRVQAATAPDLAEGDTSYFNAWSEAFASNPDYLIQRKRVVEEGIRLAFARNQRWPQLDLKTSYGLNGLGSTPAASWDDIERGSYPSWSVGVELRVPLSGGVRSRNELAAAQLRKQQALLGLKDVEVQVANALDTAVNKVRSAQQNARSYETVVDLSQKLLDTQLARLQVGKSEARRVLEAERDLWEAKTAALETLVLYQKAKVELELIKGATLKKWSFDLSQRELEGRTDTVLRRATVSESERAQLLDSIREAYTVRHPTLTQTNTAATLEFLRSSVDLEAQAARERERRIRENQDKALKVLHEKMQEAIEAETQPKP